MAEEYEGKTIPFYPDHVTTEAKVALGVIGLFLVIGLIGLFSPVGLGAPADPMDTPAHVKPEWYFLALYQVLKFVPKTTGAMIPVVLVLLVMIWPFLDRKPDRSRKTMWIRLGVTIVGLLLVIALTIWGEVS